MNKNQHWKHYVRNIRTAAENGNNIMENKEPSKKMEKKGNKDENDRWIDLGQ